MSASKNEGIIIPTDEQQYALWELMGVYAELMGLSSKISSHPTKHIAECEKFTENVKSVLCARKT